MDIECSLDPRAIKLMGDLQQAVQQLPFAVARSLTEIAKLSRLSTIKEMKSVFDRPTGWTLRSIEYRPATKYSLCSVVQLRETGSGGDFRRSLEAQFTGDDRHYKSLEGLLFHRGILPAGYALVPAKSAPLDRYGNLASRVIAQITASLEGGAKAKTKGYAGRQAKAKAKASVTEQILVARPGDLRTRGMHPGVYVRQGRKLTPLVLFVNTKGDYDQRINLPAIAENSYKRHFDRIFVEQLAKACRLWR